MSLAQVFTKSTKLTPPQITSILKQTNSHENSRELAYQVIGQLNEGIPFADVLKDLNAKKFGWDAGVFSNLHKERLFHDTLLENPPDIKDGEIECPKCHCKHTMVIEMQTRSMDEGYTYYIHCFNPKCKAITRQG